MGHSVIFSAYSVNIQFTEWQWFILCLLSFNYKVKAKKGKRKFCDTADFGNKRKKSGICVPNGHALILAQNGINEELNLMFVKQTKQDNIRHI